MPQLRRPWRPPRSGARVRLQARTKLSRVRLQARTKLSRVRLQARTKLSGHTRLESLTLSLTTSCSQPASRMCVCPCGARDSLVNSIVSPSHQDLTWRSSVKLCQSMRHEKCTKIEVGTSIMLIGLDTLQMRSWRRRCGPQPPRPSSGCTQIAQLQLPNADPNVDRGDLTIYPPWYHLVTSCSRERGDRCGTNWENPPASLRRQISRLFLRQICLLAGRGNSQGRLGRGKVSAAS